MTKREKRLQKIRQNPKDVSFEDLRQVLEDYGFEYDRSKGSHFLFLYILGGQTEQFVVPFHRPVVKQFYVKKALEIIDQIILEQEQDETND